MSLANGYRRIGVVIPANDEADRLPACLDSVLAVARDVPVEVHIVVVLDACTDESLSVASRYGQHMRHLCINERNVGAARAAGFRHLHSHFGTGDDWWYATTDADSEVRKDWLVKQLQQDADMVLGLVEVRDWADCEPETVRRYETAYRARIGAEHSHVHGANMGFRGSAYWDSGGFHPLATGEDVDLVRRFEAAGYPICRHNAWTVATSARTRARAPLGFSHYLNELAQVEDAVDMADARCA